jgi:hypothetical protein
MLFRIVLNWLMGLESMLKSVLQKRDQIKKHGRIEAAVPAH